MTLSKGIFMIMRVVAPLSMGIAIWQIVADQQNASVLLPTPREVLAALILAAKEGSLIEDTAASLRRVLVGYILGSGTGFVVGVLLLSRWVRWMLLPILEVIRPIPPLAWIPLALLWFGFGDPPAYFLVALGSFFPVLSGTHHGLTRSEVGYMRAAHVLGLSRYRTLTAVILPQALPSILAGMKVGLGVSWMIVVTAELVGAQSGLGYMIQLSRMQLQTDRVVAAMLVIGLVGYGLAKVMVIAERVMTPWRYRGREWAED